MNFLRRFDAGLARGEAAIATVVLLSLVVVAAIQSFLRNMADQGFAWANDALSSMAWGDPFMEKATLWLAMFGASLATYHSKHIGIDVVARVVGPKPRAAIRGITLVFAGVTCFYFARVVLAALLAKSGRIPAEWGVLDGFDTVHVCQASAEALSDARMDRPGLFCSIRSTLRGLGLTVNTPTRAMDLLVPAMFLVISVRFVLKGFGAWVRIGSGGIPDDELEGGSAHGTEGAEGAEG
ncbi:MAG: TRAP transporter small permease [Sandaracinus sp.]|nr:TRAP transporter small permease [Sandaracinus sp.]MCB9632673.1 TRAP transporter small permease [Sandaracinus sp.]